MKFFKDLMAMTGNGIGLVVYAIIIGLFIVGVLRCVLPVVHTRGRLRRAIRSIKSGSKERQAWQEDKFLGRGSLYPHWSEYLNNLFFAADGSYHNPSSVEDYINEETVINGPGRAAFAEALPGLMVSLGFLGTLVGLAMGLAGFDMTDSAAVQNSILTLIPGMRYAFTTSIVGVIASVTFTLVWRFVNGSTEHTLQNFYGAMSRYAGVLSVDPMTQIAIYQQEQTALIQTMAQDLNGQLTDRMAEAMQQAMEPVNQNLTQFVRVATEDQMRFLDRVVNRFVDRMDASLDGKLTQLGAAIGETAENQKAITQEVRAAMLGMESSLRDVQQLQTQFEKLTTSLDACMARISEAQGKADDGYMRIASNAEQLELVSRQQIGYLKSVSGMHAEVTQAVESLKGSVETFAERFAQQSADASTALIKAAGELKATGTALESHKRDFSAQLDKDLNDTMDSFRDYMEEFTRRVDRATAGITQSLAQLPGAVDDTSGQLLDEIERLAATLARAQQALDDAVDRLYGN